MKTILNISILMMLTLILTSSSFAQLQYAHEGHTHQKRPPRFDFTQLDLTADQATQIQRIEEEHMANMKPIHDKMQAMHKELQGLRESNASKEVLKTKHQEMCNIKAEMDAERDVFQQKIKSVLNEEQWKRFEEMRPSKPSNKR